MSTENDEKPEFRAVPAIPDVIHDGKDHLTFAEFPLATISDRVDATTETLTFRDSVFDKATGKLINRCLTITGATTYGLPTTTDDQVLLALLQLAKLQKFKDRTVFFSRYQIIKLLKWPLNGQSYKTVKESMERWAGVLLNYENAWRDKATNQWVSETFHILDRIRIFENENAESRPRPDPDQGAFEFASSFFSWNEVVFKSFEAGSVKALDFEFVMGLKGAICRRLYRFLDKRFFFSSHLEFDVLELAFEHIGLSRNTMLADAKRKLSRAITELEEKNYLVAMSPEQRFVKIRAGKWNVVFKKASAATAKNETVVVAAEKEPPSQLEQLLIGLGIKPDKAAQLVRTYPEAHIRKKVEVLEFLMSKNDASVPKNPPGFLISSIEREYDTPSNFQSKEQREAKEKAKLERQQKAKEREERQRQALKAREDARNTAIENFWNSLTTEGRRYAEEEAMAKADRFQRELVDRGGSLGKAAMQSILEEYAMAKLGNG